MYLMKAAFICDKKLLKDAFHPFSTQGKSNKQFCHNITDLELFTFIYLFITYPHSRGIRFVFDLASRFFLVFLLVSAHFVE